MRIMLPSISLPSISLIGYLSVGIVLLANSATRDRYLHVALMNASMYYNTHSLI